MSYEHAQVTTDNSVYIERIHSNVAIVRRHGTSFRRLGFTGSDGHMRYFIVQTGQQFSNNPGAWPESFGGHVHKDWSFFALCCAVGTPRWTCCPPCQRAVHPTNATASELS